ncbi:uncharacterized protein LOC129985352 [Argiope bruennichi]|uniref:uncharacterized protein LOC129985352 n=1 Tax=Argiope bruennichi TaxID=94029 RepID=UPI00249462D2|nr:uncharacterized protein LOC129985352 [Argiope bruennichi]XP_055951324.1 uncharacterized protein LOC129985352 [Argiope bruennichi]XP_055951325.1 uncharacterized protein LOC129985352 [Argiope bruennichi]XP_055951326.1 uncharacterized protein LOC129985352 [Argiope bruennichi]
MPAHDETSESAQPTKVYLLDMKDILTLNSKREEKRHLSDIVDTLSIPQALNGVSNYKSCDIDRNTETGTQVFKNSNSDVSLAKFSNYDECCKDSSVVSSKFVNLKITDSFTSESSKCNQSAQFRKYSKKSISELNSYSLKELQILFEDLTRTVEAVSGELVQLLLENDALQQESDARNIAIEQLLQLAVRNTENELRPIQMSVILPADESDAI